MLALSRPMTAILGIFLLSRLSSAAEAHSEGPTVFLNSVPVLELKSESVLGKPDTAATIVAKRLKSVDDEGEVKIGHSSADLVIQIGGTSVLTVSSNEALAHKTSLLALSNRWAASIREALALPALKFSVESLQEPVGTARVISLVGSSAVNASVTSSDEKIAKVAYGDGRLKIECLATGEAEIRATSGNVSRTLSVSVRPTAANFPQKFSVEVTGHPASAERISNMVAGCIRARLVRLPGANCSFLPVEASALPSGSSRTYEVRVRARASHAYDSVGTVEVKVINTDVTLMDDTALWYSNSPEAIPQIGPLFDGFLKKGLPVRFLYHHINASSLPMIVRGEAINDTDEPATVLVISGDTLPDKNPVRAGLTAATKFLKDWESDSGDIVALPPHTTFPISIHRLSPSETMSGLCSLRLLSGPSELQVRMDALPAFELASPWYDAVLSTTPWREAGTHPINDYDRATTEPSQHIYPSPNLREEINYAVGGRFGYLLLGQKPLPGQDHTSNLDGNFGVLYNVKVNLTNPTRFGTEVAIVLEASAGYMGGVFLVDKALVRTPLIEPKRTAIVAKFRLEPGAKRSVDLVTLPVSGGSYPATIYVKPVEK